MEPILNYKYGETTVEDFLLHSTQASDIVWITDCGYHADMVYIDSEDLFRRSIPDKYSKDVVYNAKVVGTYVFFKERGSNINTGRYIELDLDKDTRIL